MVVAMSPSGSRAGVASQRAKPSLAGLNAMAQLACQTNLVVHVVIPRRPGVVNYARQVAREVGIECSADLRAYSVRVRFGPAKTAPRP
jgi:hypothetical protein